jgi:zinc transporter ZupT
MEHLAGLGFVLVSAFMGLVCGTGIAVAGEVKQRFRDRGQYLIWLAGTALVLGLAGLAGFLKLQTSAPERFMDWAIAAIVLGFLLPFGIVFRRKRG